MNGKISKYRVFNNFIIDDGNGFLTPDEVKCIGLPLLFTHRRLP